MILRKLRLAGWDSILRIAHHLADVCLSYGRKAIATGEPLLTTWEELDAEIAERRGGYSQPAQAGFADALSRVSQARLEPPAAPERKCRMPNQDAHGASFEVSWQMDGTTVTGTLIKPDGAGPFPGVVMVAGSGPTDRDWNSPLLPGTNGSARLIAEALLHAGFASLRYDKRVTGPHANENIQALMGKISMQSHVDEFAEAVQRLADHLYILHDRIFALANSEGTLHALNYQLHNPPIPLAGLVLIGPPGRPVGVVARAQLAAQAAALPNGDALLALYDQAIARFLAGEPVAPDPALPQGVQVLLQALETPANLPFARELWLADAAPLLAQVDIPALVVIGNKDLQVDWQADGTPLQQAAAGHANVTFLFPEDANHVLKHEPRPRAELTQPDTLPRYNAPDTRLDPQAMTDILKWLTDHM